MLSLTEKTQKKTLTCLFAEPLQVYFWYAFWESFLIWELKLWTCQSRVSDYIKLEAQELCDLLNHEILTSSMTWNFVAHVLQIRSVAKQKKIIMNSDCMYISTHSNQWCRTRESFPSIRLRLSKHTFENLPWFHYPKYLFLAQRSACWRCIGECYVLVVDLFLPEYWSKLKEISRKGHNPKIEWFGREGQ